jgi:hypothetical protein
VRVAKTFDKEGRIEDGGVVFGGKAGSVSIAGLRTRTVDAVDAGGDRSGSWRGVGGGAAE